MAEYVRPFSFSIHLSDREYPAPGTSNTQLNELICIETGRWSRALLPINQFAQEAEEVQNRIVQIRRLCEELLNKNVDTIKQLNFGKYDEFTRALAVLMTELDLVHSNLGKLPPLQLRLTCLLQPKN